MPARPDVPAFLSLLSLGCTAGITPSQRYLLWVQAL